MHPQSPRAYYNEHDPFAAAWLRSLIASGEIAPGDVDERDIRDIVPADLAGYTQCHFFAGIGVWSAALRRAGVRDDEHVWTGSCPCQPFSAAGQRAGFDDERHLWPAFFHLIGECGPARLLGEQVASPDALRWLDLVSADLEAAGYAFGAADLCAAGDCVAADETNTGRATIAWIRRAVLTCPDPALAAELLDFAEWSGGALGYGPAHIRQRLCWVADSNARQRRRIADREGCVSDGPQAGRQQGDGEPQSGGAACLVADADEQIQGGRRIQGFGEGDRAGDGAACERSAGLRALSAASDSRVGLGLADGDGSQPRREAAAPVGHRHSADAAGVDGERSDSGCLMGDASRYRERQSRFSIAGEHSQESSRGSGISDAAAVVMGDADDARPQGRLQHRHGADQRIARPASVARYNDPDWIVCTDGKARPVEPGAFPLAHGIAGRVGRLRGYGNAMHLGKIEAFIRAANEACADIGGVSA